MSQPCCWYDVDVASTPYGLVRAVPESLMSVFAARLGQARPGSVMPVRTAMPVRAVVHEQTVGSFGLKDSLHLSQGRLAQRGPGELGDARSEPRPRPEAEIPRRALGGGHDVPDVAEAVLPGHHGLDVAERARQRTSHLAHRVRLSAGHVVTAQGPFGTIRDRRQGQQVGPGHVADVHEVAALAAVLE